MEPVNPSTMEPTPQPKPATRSVAKVQELATTQIQTQKGKVADLLETTGSAIRQAGQGLKDQGQQGLAEYVDQGAEKVESASTYLRDTDAQELIAKAQETARKQPLLLMGAGFAVAFVVARLLKGSGGNGAQPSEAGADGTEPIELGAGDSQPPPQPADHGDSVALVPVAVEETPKPRRRRARATAEPPA